MESPRSFSHVELAGGEVRLRPVKPDDAPRVYELFSDDRVTRNLAAEAPATLADEQEWCRKAVSLPWEAVGGAVSYELVIENAQQPGLAGIIGLHQRGHSQQYEVGYWLGVPYWGQGLATEALRLAAGFAFQHLHAVRVWADVFVGNDASRRVLEKNGFRLDATLRSHFLKRGQWLDVWFFSLLRSEWEARRDWYRPRHQMVAP